jgi:glyoxylase-like metal-dependent hydrolase (beta-lactamase superfamily II)
MEDAVRPLERMFQATTPRTHGVGSLRVTSLYDGRLLVDPDLIYSLANRHFPVLPGSQGLAASDWEKYSDHLTDRKLELWYGGFLIQGSEDRVILVDIGQGPTRDAPEPELEPQDHGHLLASLAAAGIQPEQITDVIFTHLHFDHVGWASAQGKPVFPNATYRCHAADLAHFGTHSAVTMQVLEPILGQLETWSDEFMLSEGVRISLLAGHTPGTSLVRLESEGERLVFTGDVFHCAVDLLNDAWAGMADADAHRAHAARVELAGELEAGEICFMAAHFRGFPVVTVTRDERGERKLLLK